MELFNNVSTDPENGGPDRTDDEVRKDILELFSKNEYLRDRNLNVTVKDCVATLEGTVFSRQSWQLAADLASDVRGVSEIKNNIQVKPDQK